MQCREDDGVCELTVARAHCSADLHPVSRGVSWDRNNKPSSKIRRVDVFEGCVLIASQRCGMNQPILISGSSEYAHLLAHAGTSIQKLGLA
jgi:hypothetical protein